MKTYAHLFEKVCSFESLLAGYYRARRGKGSREEVSRFGYQLEPQILKLQKELTTDTYVHGAYRQFVVQDSKRREIKAAPFRDRVVHQSVCAVLEPLFDRSFIFDTYACRKRKGTHAALSRFEQYSRVSRYALSMDISKYFASIDHHILLSVIARKVSDARMLELCRLIIESNEDSPGRGIPIGNLTSQLFANIYLNEVDQYAKHMLRLPRYVRYMDDMVIFHNDKDVLHETKEMIRVFMQDYLRLSLHPRKAQVVPITSGIEFLGYRIFPHHRLLRKSTVKRFVARTRQAKKCIDGNSFEEAPIRSWLVYARDASSFGLRRSLSAQLGVSLI